jgi:uncharacterized protein (DUF58 family)
VSAVAGAGRIRPRAVLAPLTAALRARMARWVRRRQGADLLPAKLARRRLYILPTRFGVAFALLLLLMLLAGINYANSLALFLTFLLAAFMLLSMQQVHRTLLGVVVLALEAPAVFAGGTGALRVSLGEDGRRARRGLEAALEEGILAAGNIEPGGRLALSLPLAATRRGVVRVERLRLSSALPFGLFRAWTWVHTPLEMLVYPRPLGALPMPVAPAPLSGERGRGGAALDEWAGLRAFRDGDSPRQVDWKAYAREAPLLVKEYQASGAELRLFDFATLPLADPEARLEQLARWVVDAEAGGERYGLTLPHLRLPPDRGPEHRHRCLAALARFGSADDTPA